MSEAVEVLQHLKRVEELHIEGLGKKDLWGMLTLHKRNVKVLNEIIEKYPKACLALEKQEIILIRINKAIEFAKKTPTKPKYIQKYVVKLLENIHEVLKDEYK